MEVVFDENTDILSAKDDVFFQYLYELNVKHLFTDDEEALYNEKAAAIKELNKRGFSVSHVRKMFFSDKTLQLNIIRQLCNSKTHIHTNLLAAKCGVSDSDIRKEMQPLILGGIVERVLNNKSCDGGGFKLTDKGRASRFCQNYIRQKRRRRYAKP